MRSLVPTIMLAVTLAPAVAHAQIVGGKVLIKLDSVKKTDDEARASLAALSASKELGLSFEKRSVLGWVVADIAVGDEQGTNAAVELLKREKHVVSVQTIGIDHELRAPNDPLLGELWGFAGIDVETAWDTTVGNSSQRIGLIDSGINREHVDLAAKDVGGFDFMSDPSISQDGDGRDADYSDADVAGPFHGSHVAGTMLASADDNIGVPGINWNAGLMTARALGGEGGSTTDIGEAAIWLAGGHINGVPDIGANKVSVINMSLGSLNPCSDFERDVYSAVVASGVTVVVSAGNDGNDQPTGAPANCPGVIAVGAAGPTFELAFYSNFADDIVSVIAPGGDGSGNFDSTESVLSVDGSTNDDYYALDGTSMAAPHVSGVVSLMQAVNPRLSPAQVKDILKHSPFTCGGAGCNDVAYLDAPSAVQLAASTLGELTGNEPPPGEGSGGGGGGDVCGPNSQLSADGSTCFCDPGFVVNATQDACVPSGGGDGGSGASCPPHSHDAGDGENCTCDDGFSVNAEQNACVADGGSGAGARDTCESSADCLNGFRCDGGACVEDEDSHDSDSNRFAGGCSSTGSQVSLVAFGALLLLVAARARRLRRRTPTAAVGSLAVAVAHVALSSGCAHAVHIESAPGAEIYVNDQHVGTSPVTYQETSGAPDPVKVTAKLHGKEKTISVARNDVDLGAVGAGAAAGVGGCLATNMVVGVAGFIFPPCWFAGPIGCAALGAGPGYGWYYGHHMPDNVKVDFDGAGPAVADASEAEREPRAKGSSRY